MSILFQYAAALRASDPEDQNCFSTFVSVPQWEIFSRDFGTICSCVCDHKNHIILDVGTSPALFVATAPGILSQKHSLVLALTKCLFYLNPTGP